MAGQLSYTSTTELTSAPIDSMSILIVSPFCNVNSGGGTIEVPVMTAVKLGTVLHLCNQVAISWQDLAMSDVEVVLENMGECSLVMVQVTSKSCGFEMD